MKHKRLVDLFSGTGAFSLAFHSTGRVQTVFANDSCPKAKQIYDCNFDTKLTHGDINNIAIEEIPAHDILTGGFPCQPFSIAGEQRGFSDDRSNVFWTILKIVSARRPRVVILENVKNLKTHDHGNTFKIVTSELESIGYHIRHKILNTSVVTSLPQHRERIYLVCFRKRSDYEKFNFDFDPPITKLGLDDMLEKKVNSSYYYSDRFVVWDAINEGVVKQNTIYQYRRYYVRENKAGLCPTLTANMGGGGHNVPLIRTKKGVRKLTPRECFNLQGFPADYILPQVSDSSLYKLAGNAVSIPVVKLIVNKLVECGII